jgi:hypothetical protein
LIGFLVTVVVDFSFFFASQPVPLSNPATGVQVSRYVGITEFGQSRLGFIVPIVFYSLRDLLLLIIQIALNFVSV